MNIQSAKIPGPRSLLRAKNSRLSPEFEACFSSTQQQNTFNWSNESQANNAWTFPGELPRGRHFVTPAAAGGNISSRHLRFKTVKKYNSHPRPASINYLSAIELNNSSFVARIVVDALSTPIYHDDGIDFSEKVGFSPCASPRSWSCVSRRFSRSHSAHKLPPSNRCMFPRERC
jgi:hypothetical protein